MARDAVDPLATQTAVRCGHAEHRVAAHANAAERRKRLRPGPGTGRAPHALGVSLEWRRV